MKYLFTITILFYFYADLTAQDMDFSITGSVKKYSPEAMAYLQYKGLNGEIRDSVALGNGIFIFKGKIDEPRPAAIVIKEPGKKASTQQFIKFYIEPGNLNFTAKSLIMNAVITGSPATDEMIQLNKLAGAGALASPEQVSVRTETRVVAVPAGQLPPSSISMSGRGLPPGSVVTSRKTITNISELPYEVQSVIAAMREESKAKVIQFIKDHPKSFVSMNTVQSLLQTKRINIGEYLSLLNVLNPELLESNQGKMMFQR